MRLSKYLTTLSILLLGILLTSCGTFSEEIWINADGSGRYSMYFDASEEIDKIPILLILTQLPDDGELKSSPIQQAITSGLMREKFDTNFNLIQSLPDSTRQKLTNRDAIRQDLKRVGRANSDTEVEKQYQTYKKMEKIDISIHLDQEDKFIEVGMETDFDKSSDISEAFGSFNGTNSFSSGGSDLLTADERVNRTTFNLENNRITIQQVPPANMKDIVNATDEWVEGMSSEEQEEYLTKTGLGPYTVKVHIPGTVKSVTGADYDKENSNTVLIHADYLMLLRKENLMKVEIIFEPS